MRSRGGLVAAGAAAGLVAGWLFAQYRFARHRRDLFSAQPLRRLAALGFLAGQQGVEIVHLLRDYLAWETRPVLRRRAEAIIQRLETKLA